MARKSTNKLNPFVGYVVCQWDRDDPRPALVEVIGTYGVFLRVTRSPHTRYRERLRSAEVFHSWEEARQASIRECELSLAALRARTETLEKRLANLHTMTCSLDDAGVGHQKVGEP